jgi:hypothetical protein
MALKRPLGYYNSVSLGNYCYRKCFKHRNIIEDCEAKFKKLVQEMGTIPITFQEFNSMMKDGQIKICKLPFEKRKMYVSWKRFEYYNWKDKDCWGIEDENSKLK